MDIKKVKLSELKPDKKNARKHDKRNIDEIKRSLQKNPQYRPFVVQKSTGRILVGNGMYQAMKELGITEGWVEYRDLSDEEATVLALSDNRTAELAEWNTAVLKNLFEDIGPDIDVPGWDTSEIEEFFNLPSDGVKTEIIEDEAPEPQPEAISKLGDIWLLGKHRLMCGDSTKVEDADVLMGGTEADMAFTDPPWNVNYGHVKNNNQQGYKPRTILNDSMPTDQFKSFMDAAFCTMKHSLRGGGMVYVVMSAQEWGNLMCSLASSGFHWASTIIWRKDTFVLSRKDYHTQYEPIWYGWEDSAARVCPLKDRTQSDVWDVPRPKKSDEHPTMKPIALVARAIENSSEKGANVLDLFGGSGSTLIACEQTGRTCYMMELAPHYVDVIIRRWQALTGGKAIHEKTGEIFPG